MLSFMLVGVGGQGTILASNILAELGLILDYDVKKAEVHGMSQRGGSVTSYVRWGKQVFSPIVPKGDVDILVAFEKMEAVRYYDHIHPNGLCLVNDLSIIPITVSANLDLIAGPTYPTHDFIQTSITTITQGFHWINGFEIAESLSNSKTANVVVLGALSALMDIDIELWYKVIETRIPTKYILVNKTAFEAGRRAIQDEGLVSIRHKSESSVSS